ncbi:interleukin-4 receptor subunit alpha-like [Rana temporaria]|uniref:interleukin-4 receptor subunit alpha-like n=1 Tax=Rana temporaria TaxID=8407 RepID=UPI001AADC00D|nr:interleukin-4 receptor subunit alpha-like [Rana temporaria]
MTTDEMATAVLKMGKNRIKHISLIWVVMSLTALSGSDNIPRITNLDCFNDLQAEIVCFWDVDSNSNCSEDFVLSYEDFDNKIGICRDLQNEPVPNKCLCKIPVSFLSVAESYEIKVKSHGESVGNTTIHIESTVKPRAPSNVRVDFQEDGYGVVQWNTGYESATITDNLSFQVQIINKNNGKVTIDYNFGPANPKYPFNKKQLKRGENYAVRVRAKPVLKLRGTWSEWSSEDEWRNDYSLTILDRIDIIIPIICIVLLCLIIVSYICLSRYKKKWWDTIPNPEKSMIVKRNPIQKHQLIPHKKDAAKKSCGSFFNRIIKAHKSRCGQLTQHDTIRHPVIGIINSDCKKFIFEPKNEDIEKCVEMYPKEECEDNPVQEDQPEHKAEDLPLEEDFAITNMFFAILSDSSSLKLDTFENLHTGFDKEEKQQNNLNVPELWKLGSHNYNSDNSLMVSSPNIDVVNIPCFDRWPDNEIDSIPYSPQASIKDNSYQSKGNSLASPGYNSFANAISEARKDFMINTTKSFCPDNFSKTTVLDKNKIYEQQLSPNNILYHNTKYLCSHHREDSFQPNIKPKSGQIILQCQESKPGPTYLCKVSGYQSFDQAVQESELDLGCQWSGYKSFDQAVHHSDETSVNEMNGYKSFDQAVQENHPVSGCYISGYKSFEQTLQEGDDTSVHESNGYQSFDQAIQESETSGAKDCSVLDSGYKPFESLIFQNHSYSDKNGCICENDDLRDRHCENNTNFDNNQEYRLLSSGSMELIYKNSVKATKKKYPSFGDKTFNALKRSVGANNNTDMTLKHEGSRPLALTFDICEHLRNLENLHRHKVPLINLENSTILIHGAIFPCHLDKGSFTQEQLTINKNLSLQKFPSTSYTFENTSFHMPLYELDALDSSQTTKHLLIQQSSLDKDGNSYMKIK